MTQWTVLWDLDDDERGNVRHISEHGLTKEDVEQVLLDPVDLDRSRSTGRPIAFGFIADGRYVGVVYEKIDDATVYPITAFDVDDA